MGATYSENLVYSCGSLWSSQGEDEGMTNAKCVGTKSEVEREDKINYRICKSKRLTEGIRWKKRRVLTKWNLAKKRSLIRSWDLDIERALASRLWSGIGVQRGRPVAILKAVFWIGSNLFLVVEHAVKYTWLPKFTTVEWAKRKSNLVETSQLGCNNIQNFCDFGTVKIAKFLSKKSWKVWKQPDFSSDMHQNALLSYSY